MPPLRAEGNGIESGGVTAALQTFQHAHLTDCHFPSVRLL